MKDYKNWNYQNKYPIVEYGRGKMMILAGNQLL